MNLSQFFFWRPQICRFTQNAPKAPASAAATHSASAALYWNASTRFTAGGEFGMGAEFSISTDNINAPRPDGPGQVHHLQVGWLGQRANARLTGQNADSFGQTSLRRKSRLSSNNHFLPLRRPP